jgi:hypothetical protein
MGLLVCSQINMIDIMTRTDLLKVSFFACVGSSHLVKRERGVKTQSNRGKLSVLVTLVALATVWAAIASVAPLAISATNRLVDIVFIY